MFAHLSGVGIAAVRTVVPTNETSLDDEAQYYCDSRKIARLKTMFAMDKRRLCPPDVTASDLCAYAAEELFRNKPELRETIDALVFLSQSPDWRQPATACELQHRLGLPRSCAAFDVNQGCSGYIYGLWIAASLLCASTLRNVLLLAGDRNITDVENRVTAPVFGDGGSVTLITRAAGDMYFDFSTDGSGFEAIITPGGGARIPFTAKDADNVPLFEEIRDASGNPWRMIETYMDGPAIFNFTMETVPDHILEFMTKVGKNAEDIDFLILHQANGQIVREIARRTGFPEEKTPAETFSRYGNLSVASIPATLCDAFGVGGASRVLMCGYGIGLSWGSCLCSLANCDIRLVLNYETADQPTRAERIKRWHKILKGEISRHDKI